MEMDSFTSMQELIGKLSARLTQPLPGRVAHEKMLPGMSPNFRIKHTSDPRRGAVLILLFEGDGEIKFPLIQRPVYEGVHSGQMALPGGKFEQGDDHLVATALRETQEEIGVSAHRIQVIGVISEFFVAASNHLVLPVIGYTTDYPQFVPEPREVEEIVLAPLTELLDETRIKETEIITSGGYRIHSPYFELQGKVVWGATAMILSEFVHIIREL